MGPAGATLFGMTRLRRNHTKTLLAFYDFEVSPTSFDFTTFVTRAEIHRRELGLDRVCVAFVPGRIERFWGNEPQSMREKQQRLEQLLTPLCSLMPSCIRPIICEDRARAEEIERAATHVFPLGYRVRSPIPDAFQWAHLAAELACGCDLPAWRAPADARARTEDWLAARSHGRKVISITLREADYYAPQNSRLEEWGAFARGLDQDEYFPVVVRDTSRAHDPLPRELRGIDAFAAAAVEVPVRAALYERSYVNLSVATGPMLLLWLLPNAVSVVFKLLNLENLQSTPVPIRGMGLEPGDPAPLGDFRRQVVWEPDSQENIQRGFDRALRYLGGKLEPAGREHPFLLARRLRDTGRLGPALRIYSHLSRTGAYPYAHLGRALAELKRPNQRKLVRLGRALWELGGLAREDRSIAERDSQQLLERALFEERVGLRGRAEHTFRRVLDLEPSNAVALHRLGRSALSRGQVDGSLRLLGAATTHDPYDPDLQFDLARAYEAAGEKTSAQEHLQRAALYDPSHRAAREALEHRDPPESTVP